MYLSNSRPTMRSRHTPLFGQTIPWGLIYLLLIGTLLLCFIVAHFNAPTSAALTEAFREQQVSAQASRSQPAPIKAQMQAASGTSQGITGTFEQINPAPAVGK